MFSGRFESQINSLSERIDSLRVLVEGAIDFSDEDEDLVPMPKSSPDLEEKAPSKLIPKEIEKVAGMRKKKKHKTDN